MAYLRSIPPEPPSQQELEMVFPARCLASTIRSALTRNLVFQIDAINPTSPENQYGMTHA